MRLSAEWMNLIDDRILELLADEDRPLTPSDIIENDHINFSAAYVGRRFRKLREVGLVSKVHPKKSLYVITDEGRAYLDEEYDVAAGMYADDMNGSGENDISADERV